MDIVVFVDGGEERDDLGALRFGHVNGVLGNVTHLGSRDDPTGLRQELAHGIQIGPIAKKARADVAGRHIMSLRFDVLGAGFDGDSFEVLRGIGVMGLDDTDVVEHPGDAANGAELAGFEKHANLGRGAAAIVGETLDDDRTLWGAKPS